MYYLQANWPAPNNIHAYTITKQGDITQLALPSKPIWLQQVHSNRVIIAEKNNEIFPMADAIMTMEKNMICAVRTADCLPLFMCDRQGSCVAAVHAGWRGLASGVIEHTILTMPARPENLLIWLGPAIGPTAYEVGGEVRDQFLKKSPDNKKAFKAIKNKKDKYLANLYLLATFILNKLNITAIYGGDRCTYTEGNYFYSYRRDRALERMVHLIWFE